MLLRRAILSAYLHAKILLDRIFRNRAVKHIRATNSTLLSRALHAKVDTLPRT